MADKSRIDPPELGEPVGPFARAIRVGNHLYISGTTALSQESGDYYARPIPSGIEAQTRQTFENIRTVVQTAGGTMADIVKVEIILKNQADYKAMNAVRAEFFPDGMVSSCTLCADLVRDDVLIEVTAQAVIG